MHISLFQNIPSDNMQWSHRSVQFYKQVEKPFFGYCFKEPGTAKIISESVLIFYHKASPSSSETTRNFIVRNMDNKGDVV